MNSITPNNQTELTEYDDSLALLGKMANQVAAEAALSEYQSGKSPNTIRRQRAGLELFSEYLREKGVKVGDLFNDPQAWHGITWGLVAGFMRWQLAQGYAVSSANVRLSTVKVYAEQAHIAGALSSDDLALIRTVKGKSRKESKNIDQDRESAGMVTRIGAKKAEAVKLTREQAEELKDQPDHPQGRRDQLLMCLMLDLGLRVGEVAGLQVGNFDLENKQLVFYREKVDKWQTHNLINGSYLAAKEYITRDAPAIGPVLKASANKSDGAELFNAKALTNQGMSKRAITERVRVLGEAVGVSGLSAHDCRHYWATQAAKESGPFALQEAGGWASLAMPRHYIEAAKIANQGIVL